MFEMNRCRVLLYTTISNKVTIISSWALICLLFGWENEYHQQVVARAWQKKTYRLIFYQMYKMILAQLGLGVANKQHYYFLTTILLIYWILLYTIASSFLPLTKVNKKKGLQGWMTQFSIVLYKLGLPSLGDITCAIQQEHSNMGSSSDNKQWLICYIILVYILQKVDLEVALLYKHAYSLFQLGF